MGFTDTTLVLYIRHLTVHILADDYTSNLSRIPVGLSVVKAGPILEQYTGASILVGYRDASGV